MPKWRNFAKSVVDVIKLFLEEIWISPKLRNGKKLFLMSEPALKYENNASFEQIYTQKLLIAFKMACYCCFSFGGNLDFPEFLQKNIYNINYCTKSESNFPELIALEWVDLEKNYAYPMESYINQLSKTGFRFSVSFTDWVLEAFVWTPV